VKTSATTSRRTIRALRWLEDLFDAAAAKLAEFPNLGHPGQVPGTRELIPHRSYRLVYRVEDDAVAIVRLIHTSRLWPPPPE
jgi:plasmid stabilization system protein ParE